MAEPPTRLGPRSHRGSVLEAETVSSQPVLDSGHVHRQDKEGQMEMRTTRRILILAVMLGAVAAAYVSAQEVASLVGKWRGIASPTRGSNVPLEVEFKPDGSYTSKWGATMGKGTVKKEGGKLIAEGQIVMGSTAVAAG